jgi:cysteine desulfurase/selenocysteine lyase
MELSTIRKIVPPSVLIAVDAAQSIGHTVVDVQRLGVDFLSFSGHKMFAGTGIGVLWINKSLHNQMHPFMVGGETELKQAVYQRLEAGTPHIAGIIGLSKAIDFINSIGLDVLHSHLIELTQYAIAQLKQLDGIKLLPGYAYNPSVDGYGILAFQVQGISSSDVGFILDEHNIFVRTGTHCRTGTTTEKDSIRISMNIYNTHEEIDTFISALKSILKTL